ncbi:hypothetical protein PVAND_014982 [Polypedilum vanderplanki]|uniref:Uncharacterized protein n=1 Tax=Polypedilum vanderplanki TaxID=319348 RepID=A0A9J6BBQ8_POLVA|nr:hypothetical protein PVAND_014982 [Polypedilum vanderplanki]
MRVYFLIFIVLCTFALTINGDHRPMTTSKQPSCEPPTLPPKGKHWEKYPTCQFVCDNSIPDIIPFNKKWDQDKCEVVCVNKPDNIVGTWDENTCQVIPPPSTAVCVQNVICIQGDHWDINLCRCVPNESSSPQTTCDSAMRAREAAACAKKKGKFNAETCQCTV